MPRRPVERTAASDPANSAEPPLPQDGKDGTTEAPALSISGGLLGRLKVVWDTEIALMMGIGFVDDHDSPVLIPCVELSLECMQIDDDENAESLPQFSETITVENAAYMLARLATDFSEACRQLRAISEGGLKPESSRITETLDAIKVARAALSSSVKDLDATSCWSAEADALIESEDNAS